MVVCENNFCQNVSAMGKAESRENQSTADALAQAQILRSTSQRLNKAYGRKRLKHAVISTVIDWFLDQPSPVKHVILGEVQDMELAYAEALEEMAARLRGGKRSGPPAMRHGSIPHLPDE